MTRDLKSDRSVVIGDGWRIELLKETITEPPIGKLERWIIRIFNAYEIRVADEMTAKQVFEAVVDEITRAYAKKLAEAYVDPLERWKR